MVRGNGQHVHNSHFLLDSQCHEAKDCVVTNSSPHKAQGSGTEHATNELLKEGADGWKSGGICVVRWKDGWKSRRICVVRWKDGEKEVSLLTEKLVSRVFS